MVFKQATLYQCSNFPTTSDELAEKLAPFTFVPCLPTLPITQGWVTPIQEEDAPLVHNIPGYWIICMQFEEKVLPATVVRQELNDTIKDIEKSQGRRVRQKEKYALKDEITHTLLPRAFSKLTRVYAYLDIKNNYLVIDSLKHAIGSIQLSMPNIKNPMPIMTQWLAHNSPPPFISIDDKQGVLQHFNQQQSMVRCQHQDWFANSMQSLVKEGYQVKQLALLWREQVSFVLHDDFSFRHIRLNDEVLEVTKDHHTTADTQPSDVDYILVLNTLSALFKELLELFAKKPSNDVEK